MYRETPLLRSGECEMVCWGNDVFGCRRFDGESSVFALINRGAEDVSCFGTTVPARGFVLY